MPQNQLILSKIWFIIISLINGFKVVCAVFICIKVIKSEGEDRLC